MGAPLIPRILWSLWTARDLLLFERKCVSAGDSVTKAVINAKKWEDAAKILPRLRAPSERTPPPPPPNIPICSSDGAWSKASMCTGMGWTLVNAEGFFITNGSSVRSHVSSALTAVVPRTANVLADSL